MCRARRTDLKSSMPTLPTRGVIAARWHKVSKSAIGRTVVVTSGESLCRGSATQHTNSISPRRWSSAPTSWSVTRGHSPSRPGFSVTPRNLPRLEDAAGGARLRTGSTGLVSASQNRGLMLSTRFKTLEPRATATCAHSSRSDSKSRAMLPDTQRGGRLSCHSFRNHERMGHLQLRQNGTTLELMDFRTLQGTGRHPQLIDLDLQTLRLRPLEWCGVTSERTFWISPIRPRLTRPTQLVSKENGLHFTHQYRYATRR